MPVVAGAGTGEITQETLTALRQGVGFGRLIFLATLSHLFADLSLKFLRLTTQFVQFSEYLGEFLLGEFSHAHAGYRTLRIS